MVQPSLLLVRQSQSESMKDTIGLWGGRGEEGRGEERGDDI